MVRMIHACFNAERVQRESPLRVREFAKRCSHAVPPLVKIAKSLPRGYPSGAAICERLALLFGRSLAVPERLELHAKRCDSFVIIDGHDRAGQPLLLPFDPTDRLIHRVEVMLRWVVSLQAFDLGGDYVGACENSRHHIPTLLAIAPMPGCRVWLNDNLRPGDGRDTLTSD